MSGKQSFEQVIEFFLRAERARRGFVAHLDEVFDREVGERVGIFFSPIYVNRLLGFTAADRAIHAS